MAESASARTVRLRHYQGQRLLAADLQDEYHHLTWLRGAHVVALHNTWGIALGFEVKVGPNDFVMIGPGLAYDAYGREIVLTQSRAVPGPQALSPGPDADGDYELVVTYDAELGERTAGQEFVPYADNARPGREQPMFNWRRAGETRLGFEVPLIGVHLVKGALNEQSLDYHVRRYAQPLARPHIASGVTPREQPWQSWNQADSSLGFQTKVDTSNAGFVGTPYYVATLRLKLDDIIREDPSFLATFPGFFFTSVNEQTPTKFNFQVGVALHFGAGVTDRNAYVVRLQTLLYVCRVSWFGIEAVGGCPPPPRFELIINILKALKPSLFSRTVGEIH